MSLHRQLHQRAAEGRPIRVGLIGAGKFGSMYLAQVPRTPGIHLAAIADLSPANARANLARREIAVVFEELHRRIPDIAVTEEPAMLLSAFIHGIKRLQVGWTPLA